MRPRDVVESLDPGRDPGEFLSRLVTSGLLDVGAYRDELELCRQFESATAELGPNEREIPKSTDPHNLAQTGWGILFTEKDAPTIREKLGPLLDLRRSQAGRRYKEMIYEPGESAGSFLWERHRVSPGVLDTRRVPYYLLIAGSPMDIPFDFQYQLAINHAVGRVCFDDPEDYEKYSRFVVRAEQQGSPLPRRTTIVSVKKARDLATQRLSEYLVRPLEERLRRHSADWRVEVWEQERAHKSEVVRLLGGRETPGLLLIACHGHRLTPGDPRQQALQGALVCQDSILQADDLAKESRLEGQIAFLFACYGAGTPINDNYPDLEKGGREARPRAIASRHFVARLPQAILSRGALATVGHVDRGWTLSFAWPSATPEIEAIASLEDSLEQLLEGHRLGHALRPFFRRRSALAAKLVEPHEMSRHGDPIKESVLAMLWKAHNDARNFVVLGDPAVYLLGQRQSPPGRSTPAPQGLTIRLDEGVEQYAREKARNRGVRLEQWVNDVLAARARNDGFGD